MLYTNTFYNGLFDQIVRVGFSGDFDQIVAFRTLYLIKQSDYCELVVY